MPGLIEGVLIYTLEKTLPGELLKHEGSGETFVEGIKCGILTVNVTGLVIGEAIPTNILQTTGKLIFEQAGGVQKLQQVNGLNEKHHLTAFGFESGLQSTESITFGEAVALLA